MTEMVCQGLVKKFGRKTVVNNVDLHVRQGEVVGLLGPNGAGKTTLFNMILGLVTPTKGEVYLGDKKITNMPVSRRARLGVTYLQQETSVFTGMKVWENIDFVLRFRVKDKLERRKLVEELLREFGIWELRDQYASDLSGGEKRRLELARMMALKPLFLLLDEPFVGIDPKTVKDIQQMIRSLSARNIGIIVTDHSVDALVPVVDRLYIIHKGKIIAHGEPQVVLNDPVVKEVYLGT
ncbi:ABC transporter ATP-binding protein [Pseudothermotoga hypogea DSM 11164 = NBRC 106472]|uniref:Lipopolysaccharide export system ATP-binding protein LptB n=2 Tax=Pseudothermotoga hypogea TaxID=57487 RepID=A0A0X1KSF0_9THEM|nr:MULTISPECIES: LPS export ABC transporter ATP-binding protein [Pseudothermotoga]AJC74202.1 ABC transporter ATP-binding protein [Pseudothermotoga hypogea DSM 11164 = NBRC 106472]MBC7123290.1 LPS export ABC transporter ATP-binding protein [Pseudothermotoga sp.]MDI6862097.1 LPS export ABC transporter ATP-binding protein [Pseudothermotoga sp.]